MIRLFTTFYIDSSINRQMELEECVNRNINDKDLDSCIFLLDSEKATNRLKEMGVEFPILLKNRPTYKDFIKVINEVSTDDDISIIANTDIYFDTEALSLIKNNLKHNQVYALTRYDIDIYGKINLFNRIDSQDTWCFKGKIDKVFFNDFSIGIPGCDNRIAYELKNAGYDIYNPAHDIRTIHLHRSMVRNYITNRTQPVPPPYLTLSIDRLK